MCMRLCRGVYKQWAELLEWWPWDSGMVDWIVFYFVFVIYHVVASLWCLYSFMATFLLYMANV